MNDRLLWRSLDLLPERPKDGMTILAKLQDWRIPFVVVYLHENLQNPGWFAIDPNTGDIGAVSRPMEGWSPIPQDWGPDDV